jgi:hypothetical protein
VANSVVITRSLTRLHFGFREGAGSVPVPTASVLLTGPGPAGQPISIYIFRCMPLHWGKHYSVMTETQPH